MPISQKIKANKILIILAICLPVHTVPFGEVCEYVCVYVYERMTTPILIHILTVPFK